jgi:hypothetical protein
MADNNTAIPQSLVDFIERNKINLDKMTDDQLRNGVKIANSAVKYNLNPAFPLTMAWQESAFKSDAKNPISTAYGPMQLIDATAKGLGVDSKDVDQNIDGGMRLIKELMANSRIGNDPNKVLAGYYSGPSSKFIETGDFNDLNDAEAKHFKAVLGYSGSNELPALSAVGEENKSENEAPGKVITGARLGEHVLSPEALSIIGGGLGAVVGTGVESARGVKQIADLIKNAVQNRGATPVESTRVEPTLTVEPATAGGGNTPEQNARILQGGEGETQGTTGRARQEGYNIETARRAAAKKLAEDAAALAKRVGITELEAREFLARQPGLTSTASGVIYPIEPIRETTGARTYGPPTLASQAAQSGELPIAGGSTYVVGGEKRVSPLPVAPAAAPAAASPWVAGKGALSQAVRKVAAPVARIGLGALSGAVGANQLYNAEKNREVNGLTFDNSLDYLSGAGGVIGMYPHPIPQGIALGLQAPATIRDTKRWVEQNPKKVQRLVDLGVFDAIPGQP